MSSEHEVGGSSPFGRANLGEVSSVGRALVCGTSCHGFESRTSPQKQASETQTREEDK